MPFKKIYKINLVKHLQIHTANLARITEFVENIL